jgi:hypothetical protein
VDHFHIDFCNGVAFWYGLYFQKGGVQENRHKTWSGQSMSHLKFEPNFLNAVWNIYRYANPLCVK